MSKVAVSLLALSMLAGWGCVVEREAKTTTIIVLIATATPVASFNEPASPTPASVRSVDSVGSVRIEYGETKPKPDMLEALGKTGRVNPGIYTGPPPTRGECSGVSRGGRNYDCWSWMFELDPSRKNDPAYGWIK